MNLLNIIKSLQLFLCIVENQIEHSKFNLMFGKKKKRRL